MCKEAAVEGESVRVLVVQEFWEDGERRHRAGEALIVTPEYFETYEPFLRKVKAKKTVVK